MRKFLVISLLLSLVLLVAPRAYSHCEIPCGIYGDEARFVILEEHIDTIEKSMKMIVALTQEEEGEETNYNQLVRWINNKEHHADQIQEIVCQYFMTQRIKPVDTEDEEACKMYQEKISRLHKMLISAMKTKQTTDLKHIKDLRSLLASFRGVYFGAEPGEHRKP
jgi:nickel superoxide dismutase